MILKKLYFVGFVLLLFGICSYGKLHFTNVKCAILDPSFAKFEYCFLKSVNRSFSYMSLRANIFRLPITNLTITLSLQKRANGYKPFLYNVTFDVCKFMRTRNNPVISYLMSFFMEHSNINHKCPYNHDFIVDKLSTNRIDYLMSMKLPMPKGEYAGKSVWSFYNVPRATVDLYGTLT